MIRWDRHSVKFTNLVRRDNIIDLQDSGTVPIKSGLRKLMNTTIWTEAWLVIISWNMVGQKRFVTITYVVRALRWTQKYKSLTLQQRWSYIERKTCILGQIIDLNLNQIFFVGILSIANEKHSIRNITWNAQGWKIAFLLE